MLLQAFYSIRSERQLMERLEYDLLFRWFVGLGVDDPVWDQSVFTKNRDRLARRRYRHEVPGGGSGSAAGASGCCRTEHFSVDGTLIEAWASMKSFQAAGRIRRAVRPAAAAMREPTSTARSGRNETHASTTDPDARLYRKGPGKEAKLCFIGQR